MRVSRTISLMLLTFSVVIIFCCNDIRKRYSSSESSVNVKVPDSILYAVINQALDDEPDNCRRVLDSFVTYRDNVLTREDSLLLISLDSVFTVQDVNYLMSQGRNQMKFLLDSNYVRKEFIPSDSVKKIQRRGRASDLRQWYRKNYGRDNYCSISRPLFTKTIDYTVFYITSNGHLRLQVYQRKNGRWIFLRTIKEAWA